MMALVLCCQKLFWPLTKTANGYFQPVFSKSISNLSFQKGSFPEDLKTARVRPIYKADDVNEIGNYRPISVLPCFSKILERIMCNRLFKYLTTNEILYKKQFGFQKGHSTEHATIQLIDQINNSFEKNHFTLGTFIDLSKA